MFKLGLCLIASIFPPAMLTFSVSAEAMPRPTIDAADNDSAYNLCIANGGDTNAGSGSGGRCAGAICYCCYDDGCFICNDLGGDCTWDQKARARTVTQRLKLPNRSERPKATTSSPVTRPPRGPLEPNLLDSAGSWSTQAPAASGRPAAPVPPPVNLR